MDFGIQKNSPLPLIHQNITGMRLFVKIPLEQKNIVVEAMAHHTIQDIKSMVGRMVGMSVTNQIMIYSGKQLEDCKTLAFYNDVKEECMLEMFPRSICLSVKTPTEDLKLKVKVLSTVDDVKAIVGRRIGSSVSNQNLFYQGSKLDDSKTIACYSINNRSILELRRSPEIQIFVKTWSGKTVTLDVHLSNTIKDVKSKLFDKYPVPLHFQSFVFAGKRLEDVRDLGSYNVQMHSTLHMVFSQHSNISSQGNYRSLEFRMKSHTCSTYARKSSPFSWFL